MSAMRPTGRFRHGLLPRLVVLILVAVLAPMVLLGLAGLTSVRQLRSQILEGQLAIARGVAVPFEGAIRDVLETLASIPWSTDDDSRHEALRNARQGSRFLQGSVLVDTSGSVLMQDVPYAPALVDGIRNLPALAEALQTGDPRIFRPDAIAPEGARRFFAVVPLRDVSGRVAGAAVGVCDAGSAAWTSLARGFGQRRGSRLELVDATGTVLLAVPPVAGFERSMHAATLERWGGVRTPVTEIVMIADGSRHLVAFAPLTTAPWGILVSEPEGVALAAVHGLERRWLVLAAAFVLLGTLYAWGVARSIKKPIAQLEAAAARIAGGELGRPVPVRGDDEVGRLGRSFELMRTRLRGTVDALTRSNQEMEQRVEERTHELQRLYRELSARDELRRELLAKAIRAQEEERKRIARELHDETCQALTALVMRLDLASAAPSADQARQRLDEAKGLAARSVDELHRVIYDLRPSVLDDLGLVAAVHWLAERHLTPLGIRVRFEADEIRTRLPVGVKIALFRAVQEAISNVVRHARAETVLIQIEARDRELKIEVEDDGRGFVPEELGAPSASGRGLGILGIRERLEMLGGTAQVDSSPGHGTRVVLRVPVPSEDHNG